VSLLDIVLVAIVGGSIVSGFVAGFARAGIGLPGEVVEVVALGVVELKGAHEGVEDAVGDAAEVAAFQTRVVVDADSGEHRGFFTAQPGHPPAGAVGREPGLLGGDAGAAGGEEVAGLGAVVHAFDRTSGRAGLGGSVVTGHRLVIRSAASE